MLPDNDWLRQLPRELDTGRLESLECQGRAGAHRLQGDPRSGGLQGRPRRDGRQPLERRARGRGGQGVHEGSV